MNSISILLLIFFLPFNYFFLPAANFEKDNSTSQVEGVSVQKDDFPLSPEDSSLKGSLKNADMAKNENYG